MLAGGGRLRLSPLAAAWGCGWVGANFFICIIRGWLQNRSQIGLPLFAETLQLVKSTVEAALEAAFLAAKDVQRLAAPLGCAGYAAGVAQVEVLVNVRKAFHFVGVETGFHVV